MSFVPIRPTGALGRAVNDEAHVAQDDIVSKHRIFYNVLFHRATYWLRQFEVEMGIKTDFSFRDLHLPSLTDKHLFNKNLIMHLATAR